MISRAFPRLFKVLVISLAMSLCQTSFAQAIYSVKVKLIDAQTSESVPFATASVTLKGEKTPARYSLTDEDGAATLTKLKKGTYVLRAELMGYKTAEKEFVLEKNMDLGTIKLEEDVKVLDAASVSAVGNPIIVKKDTIEYTASSFKTSDNDMLEELLKKLPGVEVEADGSITANGETINKITIDGKTFFLDDPQLASKNIPAKIIEKVKVVEKKSDQALFTGIYDGEEETIIDLSLRPGMMQGWFGNVMGGGGADIPGAGSDMSDPRFQGAAMVGRFTEKSQISLILNGNNTNNRGFNDMAGSMMQGMRMGGMGRGMGGWGGNNGIATSWMGGVNGAFNLLDDKMDLAGNYLYSGSDRFMEEESAKITYLEDGSKLFNDEAGTNTTFTQGHRMGMRLEHKFSENTSILFEPQFNFGAGYFNEYSDFSTREQTAGASEPVLVNDGKNLNQGWNNNWSTSGFFLFRQRLGKPGRTISANIRFSFNNNSMLGTNQSHTNVYREGEKPEESVNQYFDRTSRGSSLSGRAVYTEPLGNNFFFEANYNYSWNQNKSVKDVWDGDAGVVDITRVPDKNAMQTIIDSFSGVPVNSDYSNSITNISQNQSAGINFSYQKEKLRAQLGMSVNPTKTRNITNGVDTSYTVVNYSPQAMLSYEFNDNSNVRFFYFGHSAQPSTSQLMPVPDNSNPLNVSLGNPYLNPYFNHNLRGNFGYTNKKTFTSVNVRFGASLVENAITNAQWYDQSGVQYSIPVNTGGTGSADLRLMVNSPFGNSGFSIFSMTFARYNQSTSYIGRNSLDTSLYYDGVNFDYAKFHQDYLIDGNGRSVTLNESDDFITNRTQTMSFTQRLRLTYRNDFVELALGGRTRMNKSWYTMENSNLQATWSNQVDGSMNWTIPGGINLIADVNYNWYEGYTTPQEDEIILNAEITKLLFKNKFTLALKAYDILGQSKNLSVSDSANYHIERRNNTLGRYIILSLTYRFGTFNGNRGPGGPGGRPMGPHGRR